MLAPRLSETSAFVTVVEQKSFTRAAKQLALSTARVSELVRSLEERLGVRLVGRTTRSVAATAAGERLLERLRPVLDDYQAAFESMNDFRSKPAGTLRVTVPPPAADFVLAPVIARFLAQYPEISLDISVDSALVDIVAERFDAGIRPGERLARDMIAVRASATRCGLRQRHRPRISRSADSPRPRATWRGTIASASASRAVRSAPGASAQGAERSRCRWMDR